MSEQHCSFCEKKIYKDELAIYGSSGIICQKCAKLIPDILKNNYINDSSNNVKIDFPTPSQIKEHLDKYVIGQDSAKIKLSVAVYNHYKRLNVNLIPNDDIEIEKSNILLLGPSGSGKTLLCKTIAKLIDVPFVIADATSLTQSGYVGEDVESVLSKLYQASGYDIDKTETGIVFIDEIDKIGTKSGSTNITRDVSGEGVQQSLLKMLEGTIVHCPPNGGRIHPEQKLIPINTSNILFICSGAFVGIEDKIKQRYNQHIVGYINGRGEELDDPLSNVSPLDLRSFGLIPEFIGRLPIIAHTSELTESQMLKVLTEPKNSLVEQYKYLLQIDGVDLTFDKQALKYIVNKAIANKIGARGLRGMMEKVMENYMFNIPGTQMTKLNITKKIVKTILK